jgi:hypothetical protein
LQEDRLELAEQLSSTLRSQPARKFANERGAPRGFAATSTVCGCAPGLSLLLATGVSSRRDLK